MTKLPFEASLSDLGSGRIVQRGGVKRLCHVLERRRCELVPVSIQEPMRRVGELLDGDSLGLNRRTQRGPVATVGQQVCLCLPQRVAGLQQRVNLSPLRADELVDGPRSNRRLAELRDCRSLLAAAVAPELLGERVAPIGELLERQAVEIVWIGHQVSDAMTMQIRIERPEDADAVGVVHREAFGDRGDVVAGLVEDLRAFMNGEDGLVQVITLTAYEPWMTGTLVYPEPFWRHDAVGIRGA